MRHDGTMRVPAAASPRDLARHSLLLLPALAVIVPPMHIRHPMAKGAILRLDALRLSLLACAACGGDLSAGHARWVVADMAR